MVINFEVEQCFNMLIFHHLETSGVLAIRCQCNFYLLLMYVLENKNMKPMLSKSIMFVVKTVWSVRLLQR